MFFYAVFPLLGAFLVRRVRWSWVIGMGALACVLTRLMWAAGIPDEIKLVMWWYLRESRTFSPALYVAIMIAVSALVYGLIEEPANRWLRRFLSNRAPQPVPALP